MISDVVDILADIADERHRQDEKWGERHWPDGTHANYESDANGARWICEHYAESGELTWADILNEEFREARAETDWPKLRKELIQVAAVCVAWIEDGDQRGKAR
jgi:hypothetical protein